jgi:hypothetical protein
MSGHPYPWNALGMFHLILPFSIAFSVSTRLWYGDDTRMKIACFRPAGFNLYGDFLLILRTSFWMEQVRGIFSRSNARSKRDRVGLLQSLAFEFSPKYE